MVPFPLSASASPERESWKVQCEIVLSVPPCTNGAPEVVPWKAELMARIGPKIEEIAKTVSCTKRHSSRKRSPLPEYKPMYVESKTHRRNIFGPAALSTPPTSPF